MTYSAFVNGRPAKDGELYQPEMSLSSQREFGRKCRYVFSLPIEDFVECFEPIWTLAVGELKADDLLTGEQDELGSAGYPSLQVLLGTPSLLAVAVGTYLSHDIFDAYLVKACDPSCAIDTVDRVSVANGRLILEGDAYAFGYG